MKIQGFLFLAMGLLVSGCVSELNSIQKQEYASMEASNVLVEEKNPSYGAWFGILPGGGSFYSREPGMGVLNLLTWPLSMLWDPINGYEGARYINYHASKQRLRVERQREKQNLYRAYADGLINRSTYRRRASLIDQKYDAFFNGYLSTPTAAYLPEPMPVASRDAGYSDPRGAGELSRGEWKKAQLDKLSQEGNISYEEYQRRYRAIAEH